MASGVLPPGCASVRVDGDLYWEGSMYSNTPLDTVLDDEPRRDTIYVMVDLWLFDGSEPTSLEEIQTRQKDVTFASRSQAYSTAICAPTSCAAPPANAMPGCRRSCGIRTTSRI